jgi:CRISPR/Cas system CMR-associated protein Cmr1 (group 7 of RAMP superfamily)
MMGLGACILAAGIVCASVVQDAEACSCRPPPVEKAFANVDAVFTGKVIQIEEDSSDESVPGAGTSTLAATFEVIEQFKGPFVDVIVFESSTTEGGQACPSLFQVGRTYVVWAQGDSFFDYSAELCSRTRNVTIEETQDDLEWLRNREA